MRDFASFALDFSAWVEEIRPALSRPIPSEAPLLTQEMSDLEPLRFQGAEMAAWAVSYYYEAKHLGMKRLMQDGFPKSSLGEAAKAQSFAELHCRDLAERVYDTIGNRSFKVAQLLKRLEPK